MIKKITVLACLVYTTTIHSQTVKEVKGLRFYEHHSSDMTGAPFGNGADGSKSGYNFVSNQYYWSFDQNTFGAYANGEENNIDMVEHNGPFGTNGASFYLGFTSGISTIWGGSIKGNSTTKWHKLENGLAIYNAATVNADISNQYNSTKATLAIAEVKTEEVYIGRIRQSNLYVMLKCTKVQIPAGPPNGGNDNVYFEFDYKYTANANAVPEVKEEAYKAYPNPANNTIVFTGGPAITQVSVTDITGKEIDIQNIAGNTISTAEWKEGLYVVSFKNTEGIILHKEKIQIVH